jgi:hypothetical protein
MSKETNKEKQCFVRQKTFFFPEVIEQDARNSWCMTLVAERLTSPS